jgi:hypothetical protein
MVSVSGTQKAIAVPPINLRSESQPSAYATYLGMINERALLCRGTKRSNCVGTALYLTGDRKKDEYLDPFVELSVKHLKIAENPTLGCFVTWMTKSSGCVYITHIGVATSLDPLLITHREGADGYFIENQTFDAVTTSYADPNRHGWIAYYLPNTLIAAQK